MKNFLGRKSNPNIKSEQKKRKSKFEDVEEAKYIELNNDDEKKN